MNLGLRKNKNRKKIEESSKKQQYPIFKVFHQMRKLKIYIKWFRKLIGKSSRENRRENRKRMRKISNNKIQISNIKTMIKN
jgi:hypothetical protein